MKPAILTGLDMDNTLLQNHEVYDQAFRITSRHFFGTELSMRTNPAGKEEFDFPYLTCWELLCRRLQQADICSNDVTEGIFFERFDDEAEKITECTPCILFDGVHELCGDLSHTVKAVVSGGTRKLQTKVLHQSNLMQYLDISMALFLGEFETKRHALERLISQVPSHTLAYLGDAPKDMYAVKQARFKGRKVAIGVTIAGLVTKDELLAAGADVVVSDFSLASRKLIVDAING